MNQGRKNEAAEYGWWICAVLLLLMISFIFDIWGDKKAIRQHPPVERRFYGTDPVRQPFAKAQTQRATFKYNCSSCHQSLEPPKIPRKLIGAHEDIVLHHEEIMTCYTCHSRDDREKLNDIYGNEVAFESSENLCRRCHGPRYRDWKLGIHGRPVGYWDRAQGESINLTCVYCHNPHAPKFGVMEPSPPPSRDNYIIGDRENKHE